MRVTWVSMCRLANSYQEYSGLAIAEALRYGFQTEI